jgi:hypothetical protein
MQTEISDAMLLALGDQYEHNNQNWIATAPSSVEEYEDFRERYATKLAEGLLRLKPGLVREGISCQFTDAGYLKYSPRISALRLLV